MNSGKLFKKDSKGSIRFWEITTEVKPSDSTIILQNTTTGQLGGNMKTSVKEIKSNKQGSAEARAPKLIETQYTKKLRAGGYFKTKREAREEKKPLVKMLAKDLKESEIGKLPEDFFPCYGQIKKNGLAGTYHKDKNEILSRDLLPFEKLKDLASALGNLGYDYLDHELFAKGFIVSDISSMVSHGDKRICAYIFDVPREDDRPFTKRMEDVMKIKCRKDLSRRVFTVPTIRLNNPAEVKEFYQAAVAAGEEGITLRPADGVYKWNNKTTRGRDLYKVKPLLNEEFKVVKIQAEERVIEGTKRKLIQFVCVTEKGKEFKITPSSFGVDKRIDLYSQFENGDITVEGLPLLNVTFREYTKNLIPFHPTDCYLREIL
jgi:hypothetical protein